MRRRQRNAVRLVEALARVAYGRWHRQTWPARPTPHWNQLSPGERELWRRRALDRVRQEATR